MLFGACAALPVAAQTVNTVISGDVAGLLEPSGVAVAPDKSIYVADSANHRIVRHDGTTTHLTGNPGRYGARDGLLGEAEFFEPRGMVYFNNGLLVADAGNNALRFIDLTAETVATYAGQMMSPGNDDGPLQAARFYFPRGLALDSAGNVLVADYQAGSIRRILAASSMVETVVSGLNGPSGLTVANNGDLYIVERDSHRILRYQTGVLTVLAGSGQPGAGDSLLSTQAKFNYPESILSLGESFGFLVSDYANHTIRRVFFNTAQNRYSVETYAGAAGSPGDLDGLRLDSRLRFPSGMTAYSTGFLFVEEGNANVKQILASPVPPRIANPKIGRAKIVVDPDTGSEVAVLEQVIDTTFENDVTIVVEGESNVLHAFESGPASTNVFQADPVPDPTRDSDSARNFVSGSPASDVPPSLVSSILPALTVKVQSLSRDPEENRTPSEIVSATFRFAVGTPVVNSAKTPGAIVFETTTQNADMWYTLDGSEPTLGTNANVASIGPKRHGDSIPLVLPKTNLTIKVKGFKTGYSDSATTVATFSATNYTPNRITLGFENGEASSDFVASPGQRFYAPVTLSLVPNATMYGLNFTMTVDPNTGPSAADYQLDFQSMLYYRTPSLRYILIPPATMAGFVEEYDYFTNVVTTTSGTETNVITITNTVPYFTNLVVTNISQRLLGVGWLERAGQTNLYNTKEQDLISYSIPHDTIFGRAINKVVPGGFSFVVPTNADTGDTYTLRVSRPSATADGISQDIYIEAPDLDDISTNKAVRDVTVGYRTYIVGDVAPFRWFNAGDFGDTNILNNDLTQFQQSIVHGLNVPMPGSDFEDAFDTCCFTTNGLDVSGSFEASDGNDLVINEIGYGDGTLDIADLFVAFRRAVDPSLVWYERFWTNGTRTARPRANEFRGESELFPASRNMTRQNADTPNGDPFKFTVQVMGAKATAGTLLQIPVYASISGGVPIRTLLMRIGVRTIDGGVPLAGNISFLPANNLGPASVQNASPEGYAAAWIDQSRTYLAGNSLMGLLQIPIPVNASTSSAYEVKVESISGSPNGLFVLPSEVIPGVVIMRDRLSTPVTQEPSADWRTLYFGSAENPAGAPDADPDQDGADNLTEYRSGTNPTDPNDALSLNASLVADSLRLRFKAVAGRTYQLETTEDISSGSWTPVGQTYTGAGQPIEIQQSTLPAAKFFRVRLSP